MLSLTRAWSGVTTKAAPLPDVWKALKDKQISFRRGQLTMVAAYYQYNLQHNIREDDEKATFELFIRQFPKNRNYLIFAGLEQAIHYLFHAKFSKRTIEFLRFSSSISLRLMFSTCSVVYVFPSTPVHIVSRKWSSDVENP